MLPRAAARACDGASPRSRAGRSLVLVSWTSMRGVVSLATALALPLVIANGRPFPHRTEIVLITMCVIVLTLLRAGALAVVDRARAALRARADAARRGAARAARGDAPRCRGARGSVARAVGGSARRRGAARRAARAAAHERGGRRQLRRAPAAAPRDDRRRATHARPPARRGRDLGRGAALRWSRSSTSRRCARAGATGCSASPGSSLRRLARAVQDVRVAPSSSRSVRLRRSTSIAITPSGPFAKMLANFTSQRTSSHDTTRASTRASRRSPRAR